MLKTASWLSAKASSKLQSSSSGTSFTHQVQDSDVLAVQQARLHGQGCIQGICLQNFTRVANEGGWTYLLRSTTGTSC